MKDEEISILLLNDFYKWFNTVYWSAEEVEEEHLKQYLGYFGINRRYDEHIF